ncbi:O-antigen ligase [Pandoraea pnomenusa]|uniref:O-antigen ligase n=1 Tax=Pandoraea pnomenusa TaxID=93220 RepID=A0ABY6WGZ6_9BURK|nr:O-antigen ligase family protein [Pandoraea pnomenusa]VVE63800.1 O-antigen ligase [Pandoraea pnomenusa]
MKHSLSSQTQRRPGAAALWNGFAKAFFFLTPLTYVAAEGGASALFLVACCAAMYVVIKNVRDPELQPFKIKPDEWLFCAAMSAPILVVLIIEMSHGKLVGRTLDSPVRFLLGVPLFLAFRRLRPSAFARLDLSLCVGAIASLAALVPSFPEWGKGRVESYFMNPIHFGDVALLLSLLVVTTYRRADTVGMLAFKTIAAASALFASLLTGSRGGWIALPVVALVYVWSINRAFTWKGKTAMTLVATALIALPIIFSPWIGERVAAATADLRSYSQGHRDTSVGVRFQLYEYALRAIGDNPISGLGAEGFKRGIPSQVELGRLTPIAGQLGLGETHNQILAYGADYGIPGILALLAIYFVPSVLFLRAASLAPIRSAQRTAALLGLWTCLAFFIFGLTVETFNLKSTVSLYVSLLAVFAAGSQIRDEGPVESV